MTFEQFIDLLISLKTEENKDQFVFFSGDDNHIVGVEIDHGTEEWGVVVLAVFLTLGYSKQKRRARLTDESITQALRAGKRIKRKSSNFVYRLSGDVFGRILPISPTMEELEADDWEVVEEGDKP